MAPQAMGPRREEPSDEGKSGGGQWQRPTAGAAARLVGTDQELSHQEDVLYVPGQPCAGRPAARSTWLQSRIDLSSRLSRTVWDFGLISKKFMEQQCRTSSFNCKQEIELFLTIS